MKRIRVYFKNEEGYLAITAYGMIQIDLSKGDVIVWNNDKNTFRYKYGKDVGHLCKNDYFTTISDVCDITIF